MRFFDKSRCPTCASEGVMVYTLVDLTNLHKAQFNNKGAQFEEVMYEYFQSLALERKQD
jgi:hypothetical protein